MVDPFELPRGCSGAWLAASPLAASDTRASHSPRAPKFGSSGRSVGALIYGLPAKASVAKFYCEARCRGDSRNGGMGGSVRGLSRPPLADISQRRSASHLSPLGV